MSPLQFRSPFFWGVNDHKAFNEGIDALMSASAVEHGWFASDNLIAFGRNLGFTRDEPFQAAFEAHAKTREERGIIWRTAVVTWAARHALRLDGDFIECGCYKGVTANIVIDAAGLQDRRFFLYDLFEHHEGMRHHAMPEHGSELFAQVKQRFADRPNVRVIQGMVPQSFEQGLPEKIAFAHIDMNNAQSEIEALEAIEDRLVPGAPIVLDDFGALPYRTQHVVETQWFQKRGRFVLELPTSQGLVIW